MPWLGGAVWLLFAVIAQPGWSAALFLLAPLVMIPLAVDLARRELAMPRCHLLLCASALPVLASYLLDQGWLAALLTIPWFLMTAWLAWQGSRGLLQRKNPWISFGMMYLAVGGSTSRPLRYQGTLQAFGFALPGLAAWHGNLISPRTTSAVFA